MVKFTEIIRIKALFLGLIIAILFFPISQSQIPINLTESTAITTERNLTPVIRYTDGWILQPQPTGVPNSSLPLNPFKRSKHWRTMSDVIYADVYEIEAGEAKLFPVELKKPSIIIFKLYYYGPNPGKLSTDLYQIGRERPLWTAESLALSEKVGYTYDQVNITAHMLEIGNYWNLKLTNNAEDPGFVELFIGSANLELDNESSDISALNCSICPVTTDVEKIT